MTGEEIQCDPKGREGEAGSVEGGNRWLLFKEKSGQSKRKEGYGKQGKETVKNKHNLLLQEFVQSWLLKNTFFKN